MEASSDTSHVPPAPEGRHVSARSAILVVGLAALILLLFEGHSIRETGKSMKPGWERGLVLAVGYPSGWASDKLGFHSVKETATGLISPKSESGPQDSFDANRSPQGSAPAVPPVPVDSFDPRQLGEEEKPARPLKKILVTGDSMAQPLDAELARLVVKQPGGPKVIRDARLGTSLSDSELVDWSALASQQVRDIKPDAVVMFLGANEGFPMQAANGPVECCGTRWAAEYAYRVRRVMNTFRQGGKARVYWLTLPAPRDSDRREISRTVNAAIAVGAQPYRPSVRVLDMNAVFTPGGQFRQAIPIYGSQKNVREQDGVHLNDAGAAIAAQRVLNALDADYRGQRQAR